MVSGSSATDKLISTLNSASTKLISSLSKISSGKRILSAADDAAGLAVVSSLESDAATLSQGTRNVQDGLSFAAIADGSLSQISDISTRQAELATQSANGTLSDSQRSSLNDEFQALEQEKTRILETTKFNDQNVFSGTTLQVGSDGSSSSQVSIPSVDTSTVTNSSANLLTQSSAQSALDVSKSQLDTIASKRGEIGAAVNRIDVASKNNESISTNQSAAASRISDLDMASEVTKAMSLKIQQQATTAFLAQAANSNANMVKSLIAA
jgi:flagellin